MSPPEERSPDWHAIAASEEFTALRRAKLRFIVPATVAFVVYYFALPILVGYAPGLMETEVFGPLNVAYVFALSQFFMAWTIAGLYVRAARRWDEQAEAIRARYDRGRERY
ncbi:MAG: DUF485 domain-containing protein [Candidatus Binatia bacterium]